jgi:hypothetical protein
MDVKELTHLSRQVRRLAEEEHALVDELLRAEPLIVGSVSHVLRRCGNPACHCAQRPTHPTLHLATSQVGQRRCQLVRKTDEATVIEKVDRYRRFRELLRRLSVLERQRRDLLKAVAEARSEDYS